MMKIILLIMFTFTLAHSQYQAFYKSVRARDSMKVDSLKGGIPLKADANGKFIKCSFLKDTTYAGMTDSVRAAFKSDTTGKIPDSIVVRKLQVTSLARINRIELDSILTLHGVNNGFVPDSGNIDIYATADDGFIVIETITDLGIKTRVNEHIYRIARNTSGALIPSGSAVRYTGSTENKPNFGLAKANKIDSMAAIGITSADVANNAFGVILIIGRWIGKTNNPGWVEGDELWVSPDTAGKLIDSVPMPPSTIQWIGTLEVIHPSQGVILVNVQAVTGVEKGTIQNIYSIGDGLAGTKYLILNGLTDDTLKWNGSTLDMGKRIHSDTGDFSVIIGVVDSANKAGRAVFADSAKAAGVAYDLSSKMCGYSLPLIAGFGAFTWSDHFGWMITDTIGSGNDRNRANHTGTQAQSTIVGLTDTLANRLPLHGKADSAIIADSAKKARPTSAAGGALGGQYPDPSVDGMTAGVADTAAKSQRSVFSDSSGKAGTFSHGYDSNYVLWTRKTGNGFSTSPSIKDNAGVTLRTIDNGDNTYQVRLTLADDTSGQNQFEIYSYHYGGTGYVSHYLNSDGNAYHRHNLTVADDVRPGRLRFGTDYYMAIGAASDFGTAYPLKIGPAYDAVTNRWIFLGSWTSGYTTMDPAIMINSATKETRFRGNVSDTGNFTATGNVAAGGYLKIASDCYLSIGALADSFGMVYPLKIGPTYDAGSPRSIALGAWTSGPTDLSPSVLINTVSKETRFRGAVSCSTNINVTGNLNVGTKISSLSDSTKYLKVKDSTKLTGKTILDGNIHRISTVLDFSGYEADDTIIIDMNTIRSPILIVRHYNYDHVVWLQNGTDEQEVWLRGECVTGSNIITIIRNDKASLRNAADNSLTVLHKWTGGDWEDFTFN